MFAVNCREAFNSMKGSKQRTFLALLGIIIGIGSVMALLSIGATIKSEALRQFRLMGTDVITLRAGMNGGPGEEIKLSVLLVDFLAKYSRNIRRASPENKSYTKVAVGPASHSSSVVGIREAFNHIKRLTAAKGRLLSFLDNGLPHAVLGSALYQKLLKGGAQEPIKEVTITNQPFTVVGVMAPANLGFQSREVDESIYVPLDMMSRLKQGRGLDQATVQLWPESDHQKTQVELQDLASRFGLPQGAMEINSPRRMLEHMEKQMELFTLLLAAVGSISLVVGGVGIMNMMLVSVTERRREIGIRRALGAQRGDITSQFLVESTMLSLTGGILGGVLGVAVAYVVARIEKAPLILSLDAMALCLGVALGVGLFFGFYPARKAAAMDVILALKAD